MPNTAHSTFALPLFRNLARAAALGALILAGFAPAAEASVILGVSCSYGNGGGGEISVLESSGGSCVPGGSEGGTETNSFVWQEYFFELTLYNVTGGGDVTIIDHPLSQDEFQDMLNPPPDDFLAAASLGSYLCMPLVDPSGTSQPCRAFQLFHDGDLAWSNYEFAIDWNHESALSDAGVGGRARVLRDIDDDFVIDEDMCLQAQAGLPNYVVCQYDPNPIIISGNTDFSVIVPALAIGDVPEPAALSLIGTGLVALWYRRRRT